jgi:hypothetical protein
MQNKISLEKNNRNILAGLRINNKSLYSFFKIIDDSTVITAFVKKIDVNPMRDNTS